MPVIEAIGDAFAVGALHAHVCELPQFRQLLVWRGHPATAHIAHVAPVVTLPSAERADMLEVLLHPIGERPIRGRGSGGEDGWTPATAVFRIGPETVDLDVRRGEPDAVACRATVRP